MAASLAKLQPTKKIKNSAEALEVHKIKAFPFDPILRAQAAEQLVMLNQNRLYYKFRPQRFYGGVATADTIGCNLLCAYCWNYARNLEPTGARGKYYSPQEVAAKLNAMREKKARISGAEPFLGEASTQHIANVLKHLNKSEFIIETNGVMLGYQPALIDFIKPYHPYVRIAIKGDSETQFEKITGATGSALEYQFKAYEELKKANVDVGVAVMPQFVDKRTIRSRLIARIEEEDLIGYNNVAKRLKERGLKTRG